MGFLSVAASSTTRRMPLESKAKDLSAIQDLGVDEEADVEVMKGSLLGYSSWVWVDANDTGLR